MKVIWATHRSWDPNVIGGAEICDRLMRSRAPADVDLWELAPGFSDYPKNRVALNQADRVIVSGMRFPPDEMRLLAAAQPLVWVHDVEFQRHPIIDFASDVVCMTPQHLARQEAEIRRSPRWSGPRVAICPGWFDTSPFFVEPYVPADERGETALWAHRGEWTKNLPGAVQWAKDHDAQMWVMNGQPRERVIEKMLQIRYFILLSDGIFDPGPWAVIESQLAGCIPIVNDLVGWFGDKSREELRDYIDHGDERFWSMVADY